MEYIKDFEIGEEVRIPSDADQRSEVMAIAIPS